MKNALLTSCIILSSTLITPSVFAAEKHSESARVAQRATIFSASAIAGGVVAGPVGLIVGAIGGAFIAEKGKEDIAPQKNLDTAHQEIATLSSHLQQKNQEIAQLESSRLQTLEFQIMFPTGKDLLSKRAARRIKSLANYLKENKELRVRLDGYADPRGTDEYNNGLSHERAKSVSNALTQLGIDKDRVETFFHGANDNDNLDSYAIQRRVNIEIYNATPAEGLVSN